MEQRSSWDANSHSASYEILDLSRHPKAHYHVLRSVVTVPILSHNHPVQTHPVFLESILILSSFTRLGIPGAFPSGFSD
jgi:hypothetical protein